MTTLFSRLLRDPLQTANHPKPWWYRLAERIIPSRCREIPEAHNPTWPDGSPRLVLRQVSIRLGHWYLQQFAGPEDPNWQHSHQYGFMIAIGLWGGYRERRIAGRPRRRDAPYLFTMTDGEVHHVQAVTPGHTSLFLGFFRRPDGDIGDKHYYAVPVELEAFDAPKLEGVLPLTRRRWWKHHIKKLVKRI